MFLILKTYKYLHALLMLAIIIRIKYNFTCTNTGHIVLGTATVLNKSVSNLPCKHRRTLPLEGGNSSHNLIGRHPRLAAPNSFRVNRSSFIKTSQNLGHAPIRNLEIQHYFMKKNKCYRIKVSIVNLHILVIMMKKKIQF